MRLNLTQVPVHLQALVFLLAAGLFVLAVAACGDDPATAPAATSVPSGEAPAATSAPAATGAAAVQPASTTAPAMISELSGDISVDGSSTVFPITEAMAEEFGIATDGNVRITVGVSGTGGGFKKFCAGEIHISDASRPIKQSEVELCAENGVEYIELPVAIDGLSVMVHPENDFVECMTVGELHTIWSPEAEGMVMKWSQVRPGWPDEELRLYAPGIDSGTFDYFTETVNGESQASRGDFLPSEDDNVLVTGLSGDRGSLGYFGYAYYTENADRLKLVAIDGGSGCITPTDETINNGTYAPLSRPLFIYVTADALNQPHVKSLRGVLPGFGKPATGQRDGLHTLLLTQSTAWPWTKFLERGDPARHSAEMPGSVWHSRGSAAELPSEPGNNGAGIKAATALSGEPWPFLLLTPCSRCG